ncbi:hypothetical protein MXB_2765, partial [Myxobolus squamalis]
MPELYVDNYGMLLENYDNTSLSDPRFLIGQINEVYYGFILREIYLDIDQNPNQGVIVFYNKANGFLGMIDVFTNQQQVIQTINVLFGSSGQQFGFSSALGRFNDNNCTSFAVSAPLYSKVVDEGVVFVYTCNPLLNKYYETPTLLFGENRSYARFGVAVASLKDVNNDGYD